MAAFRDPAGHPWLAAADIGDNPAQRSSVEVDVVPEPARLGTDVEPPRLRLRLRYPDGARDAETLLVDTARRRMLIVSKGLLTGTVYAVPARRGTARCPPAGHPVGHAGAGRDRPAPARDRRHGRARRHRAAADLRRPRRVRPVPGRPRRPLPDAACHPGCPRSSRARGSRWRPTAGPCSCPARGPTSRYSASPSRATSGPSTTASPTPVPSPTRATSAPPAPAPPSGSQNPGRPGALRHRPARRRVRARARRRRRAHRLRRRRPAPRPGARSREPGAGPTSIEGHEHPARWGGRPASRSSSPAGTPPWYVSAPS